jgi:hypothetical protein
MHVTALPCRTQKGATCSPASTAVYRVHLGTGAFEELPPLPQPRYVHLLLYCSCHLLRPICCLHEPAWPARKWQISNHQHACCRYSPSAALLGDGRLHVFGGLLPDLATPARDHWSLSVDAGGQLQQFGACLWCVQPAQLRSQWPCQFVQCNRCSASVACLQMAPTVPSGPLSSSCPNTWAAPMLPPGCCSHGTQARRARLGGWGGHQAATAPRRCWRLSRRYAAPASATEAVLPSPDCRRTRTLLLGPHQPRVPATVRRLRRKLQGSVHNCLCLPHCPECQSPAPGHTPAFSSTPLCSPGSGSPGGDGACVADRQWGDASLWSYSTARGWRRHHDLPLPLRHAWGCTLKLGPGGSCRLAGVEGCFGEADGTSVHLPAFLLTALC